MPDPIESPAENSRTPLVLVAPDEPHRLKEPAGHHHVVQFYEDEAYLCDHVARFLAAGLAAGDPAIAIATAPHRALIRQRLTAHGCDADGACATGRLTLLDARETLSRLLVDGMPDWDRFRNLLGGVIETSRRGRGQCRVRAYGEMVDLLWRDGNRQAAIGLEGLWNDLAGLHSFSLLCAYVMGNFYRADDADEFQEILRAHTHVVPTERHAEDDDPETRLRRISLLEQRARSLESELEHRKELESALREALAQKNEALAREKQLRQEAERSVRYNEMFAGVLGHDLRNPLGAIVMGANYIVRASDDERTARAATRIVSSSERMSRMIDQLLDFTRIRVGNGLALRHTRFDLAELCFKVKEELEAANPDCVIRLETRGNTAGEWDYDRLLQVFSNVVGNAIAHGTSGCTLRIDTDGSDAAAVTATVHNAGAVAPEVLPVMFEAFRGSTKLYKTQGLGLGLFITRQIVAAHGGAIDAESSDRDGTTIRVQLPRTPSRPTGAARVSIER